MPAEFDPVGMYAYMKGYCSALCWDSALRALAFARTAHDGQARKGGQPRIVHPLTMACHAAALKIPDEDVAAACLLHDACEDCGVAPDELPAIGRRAKDAVVLLTHDKGVPLDAYYKDLSAHPVASLVQLLDRCDVASAMAGACPADQALDYVRETEAYVMPLWRKAKDHWPELSDPLFVLKYHIRSVTMGLSAVLGDNAGT